jgi:hypothetical protein
MALYRSARYAEAVDTLIRADRLNAPGGRGSLAADLAFLAMAQHGMGQTDRARDTLDRLRRSLEQPDRANDEEAKALFREAGLSIRGAPPRAAR